MNALAGDLLPADIVFKMFSSFGIPVDVTQIIARERGFGVDLSGFETLLQEEQSRGREACLLSPSIKIHRMCYL